MKDIFDLPIIVIKRGEKKYPKELLDLEDPPEQLHVRGTYNQTAFANSLAIVGSRKMSVYGKSVIDTFVPALVKRGIPIVSGFMYGVDTAAHHCTLLSGGVTIAVLGHGLDYLYPPENGPLYRQIIEGKGCLISEYPNDFKPDTWTFPKRNRIVAALSKKGTVVVEAAEQSGSLITAAYADALNRPLYGVPGPISSLTSKGVNRLIKDNLAQMVITVEDIL